MEHSRASAHGNELMLAVSELGGGWGFICAWRNWKTEITLVTTQNRNCLRSSTQWSPSSADSEFPYRLA
ncbi:MAG TPA: hypothetical protein VGV87_29625, partial [Blastocatellia bacterium]|nr:hypothetical protein [Blastocatellia bacterium]